MKRMRFEKTSCIVALFCVAATVAAHGQTFNTLFTFDGNNGFEPQNLIQGIDGTFYGVTYSGGKNGEHNSEPGDGTMFRFSTTGGTLNTLHNFCTQARCADGLFASAALLQMPNQVFYGVTQMGGTSPDCTSRPNYGCGTIFKANANGVETPIYSFCSQADCADGNSPAEPLTLGPNGNLYGITFGGGSGACGQAVGCGTVFEITPAGVLTTLHTFCATSDTCADGSAPQAPIVVASNGNVYGAANGSGGTGGTFFVITPAGKFKVLHTFKIATDGEAPVGLIQGSDGNFYGTTAFGGSGAYCTSGEICGTVFKVTPTGEFTTLYNFCSQVKCADGSGPYTGLIQGSDGNFYGTTIEGGTNYNKTICNGSCGAIFQVTPQGNFTSLYNFCAQADCADGWIGGALMQATNGAFYGTTVLGGLAGGCNGGDGCGTIFSLSTGLGRLWRRIRDLARLDTRSIF